jgi:hypothetical protein
MVSIFVLSMLQLHSGSFAQASSTLCVKGASGIQVPISGRCPTGYKKITVNQPSSPKTGSKFSGKKVVVKKIEKQPCDASQLFKLKDLRDSILKAQQQIPLWQDEISTRQQNVMAAKSRGDYVSAAEGNQSILMAQAELNSWNNGMANDRNSFRQIDNTCVNSVIQMP